MEDPSPKTLRELVTLDGPLDDRALQALAEGLAEAGLDAPVTPDDVVREPWGRWAARARRGPAPEGWEPFEAAFGRLSAASSSYRLGALLFYAATGLEPSSAGLPYRYDPPERVRARATATQRLLAGCLDPDWRRRPADARAAATGDSAPPVPAARTPKPASSLAGVLVILLAGVGSLVLTVSRPSPQHRRDPAIEVPTGPALARGPELGRLLPFLKPRGEPRLPVAGASFPSLEEAAAAYLAPQEASGELLRLRVDGHDRLFIRGRLASPLYAGSARPDGSALLERPAGWVLIAKDGRRTELPAAGSMFDRSAFLDSRGRAWLAGTPMNCRPLLKASGGAWVQEPGVGCVAGLAEDARGRLWTAFEESPRRVAYEEDGRWKTAASSVGREPFGRATAVPVADGTVLAGGLRHYYEIHGEVVSVVDSAGGRTDFGPGAGVQETPVRAAVDRGAGRLYLVHWDGTLTVADADGFRRRYAANDGIPEGLYEAGVDGRGRVWLFGSERVLVLPPASL